MSYYDVLGVAPSASADQIRRVHRELVKKYHPDRLRNASAAEIDWAEKKFQEIQEAYETLSKNRGEYDRRLQAEAAPPPNPGPQPAEKRARRSPDASASTGAVPYPPIEQTKVGQHNSDTALRLRPVQKVILTGGCFVVVLLVGILTFVPRQSRGFQGTPFPQGPRTFMEPRYPWARVYRYEGVLRNQNTNVSAQFGISVLESEGTDRLTGCAVIKDPLAGSGDLSGTYSADAFVFTVKSANVKMKLTGKGRDDELSGTYSADLKNGAKESGTFDVDRVHYGEDFMDMPFYNCQTDAEVNGEADDDQ